MQDSNLQEFILLLAAKLFYLNPEQKDLSFLLRNY